MNEGKKLKRIESLKVIKNTREKKLNTINEFKDNNCKISYQNDDKLDKCNDTYESMSHENGKIEVN